MTTPTTNKIPTWFWIVAAVALLWNLMGVGAYLAEVYMSPEAKEALSEAEKAAYAARPAWAVAGFATGVFAGFLGSLGLLLRKSWAIPVLMISLGGVLVQNVHNFFLSNNIELMGSAAIIFPVVVILIGIALIWFARMSQAKGWLS